MEASDSRKRPLDADSDGGISKRSNQGDGDQMWSHDDDDHVMSENAAEYEAGVVPLKVLVPSIAAGAIIGKGGDTITQIQKETGANIKMSKSNDYYPGTTERVCLVTGTFESVEKVHEFIAEKIREKPDPNPKPVDGDLKVNFERHKQIKILVPNSTAGMIIGKGGNFIRQIKEESGSFVQISQKSKDVSLPERCVTVAGDTEQNQLAIKMLLNKIMEDPQSGSCPNTSYNDYKGPVASSNPTGSPYANLGMMGGGGGGGGGGGNQGGFNGAHMGGGPMPPQQHQQHQQPPQPPPPQMQQQVYPPGPGGNVGNLGQGMGNLHINSNSPAMENLKATLRSSGYSEQAVEEISLSMYTLANYGFLGLGLGMGMGMGSMGQPGGQAPGTLNLASLANIMTTSSGQQQAPPSLLMREGATGHTEPNPSVFGPVGSTTTTMAGGDAADVAGAGYFGDQYAGSGDSMYGNFGNSGNFGGGNSAGYTGTNQNSFGLGTNMGAFSGSGGGSGAGSEDDSANSKKELEVGEHIVGAILGPGGKGIVELQKFSGANIQISKKGVYAAGTRNRIVSMSGHPNAVQRASYMIQQRIGQEESKRARQGGVNSPTH